MKKDLIISLTRDCNQTCRICYNVRTKTTMNIGIMTNLLRKYQPSRVTLTGGEPMLHPQFIDILHLVSASVNEISLCTNGTLLTPQVIRLLGELHIKLYISWSDDIPCLKQKINLASEFCEIIIHFVILQQNLNHINSIVASLQPEKIRFLVPFNVDESPYQTGQIKEWNKNLKKAIATTVSLNKQVTFEPAYGLIGLKDYKPQCKEHIYVDADGIVYPCCLLANPPFNSSIYKVNHTDFYQNCPVIANAEMSDLKGYHPLCPLYNRKTTEIE